MWKRLRKVPNINNPIAKYKPYAIVQSGSISMLLPRTVTVASVVIGTKKNRTADIMNYITDIINPFFL